ncbi:L,D-transpeptidase catalytic domain [Syntrophomonas zehnderi OL-4]|uniref:L,D-transpeptidase catalytic domain n=1 Tax=Syntrophomonas zehnderi OL-4 TaxID=690567 RepID=A0A0E4GEA5_9FIRM|nr:peptidoglycan-binding protein [Syntrophomonas zehnderi]CFX82111.1 L,D-transpeptidase catalytic domain [Syntrophomonas zehnderi OL-4]
MIYASRFIRLNPTPMKGPDVLLIQTILADLGFQTGELDGIYGEKTLQAIKKFQQWRNLKIDGIVGPQTWQHLLQEDNVLQKQPHKMAAKALPVINVHVDTRILTLVSNQNIKTYPVAVGKPSTPTPPGNWTIVQKTVDPGGPFGARWMRLSIPFGGYGIHGTNNPSSIGKAVSHGCIRMYNNDVIELYDLVPIGTPVNITGVVRRIRRLKMGSKGNDVSEVQELLRDLGYYNASIDGIFGKVTRRAVIRFQKDQGLKPDGIVGKITLKALQIDHDLALGDIQP